MKYFFVALFLTFLFNTLAVPQSYKILHSDDMGIKISFNFENSYQIRDTLISNVKFQLIKGKKFSLRNPGEPWLPSFHISVSVPEDATPGINIESHHSTTLSNKFIIPFPKEDPNFNKNQIIKTNNYIYNKNALFPLLSCSIDNDYIMRFIRVIEINISPYQFNPVSRELIFNKSIVLSISFNSPMNRTLFPAFSDPFTKDFINSSVINPEIGQKFIFKSNINKNIKQTNSWYDPTKNYFKIYVKNKDVYRITFDELINAGVLIGGGVPLNEMALYNNGEEVPIDIHDNGDSIFNHGDYFQFVGFPPSPTQYCYFNIYNNSNVYWFSYQSNNSKTFKNIDGAPTDYQRTTQTTLETIHLEKDSIYERLGYATDDKRDFWFWGRASVQNAQEGSNFVTYFNMLPAINTDTSKLTLRLNMQGLTTSSCSGNHKADISLTGQPLGSLIWDNQTSATFEKTFLLSQDSLKIYPEGNRLQIDVNGNACSSFSDEIRINWYELEYWKNLKVDSGSTFFHYKIPASYQGKIRFWLWNWYKSNMMIYIPQKAEIIRNPEISNDLYKSVFFQDSVGVQTEYFCVDSTYFNHVDSIKPFVSSNLNSISNGADYIIITHPKFLSVAQRLANFRTSNFPDTSIVHPRIKIVDINSIYNEYSYGLLDPYAIKYFVKYAFENWQSPSPLYIVLLGDMSWDYRHLLPDSRENYIPSIPYQSYEFGQAVSDNAYVAVEGNDVTPDLCIGRLSCETVAEGNILIDKIESYPSDNSKDWKQNVLYMASGLSPEDENAFGFNNASKTLENNYSSPYGMTSSKVFHYPNPEDMQYQGGGPEIRAAFDKGAVLANYYGHGGGYQWDLVFVNDDIYMLNNGGRLPFISSVTCYTAHFDNQDIFGEQFEKIPNKGCIGFLGSSGLTLWGIGTLVDEYLFEDIFTNKNFITGKAILKAKSEISSDGLYASQIALLTYLGDPVLKLAIPEIPDFAIKSSDFSIIPTSPIVGDSVDVKIHIRNYGTIFPKDSVTVQLFASSSDTSYLVDMKKLPSFAVDAYVDFFWKPKSGGLFELKALVNELNSINEADHSDNIAVTTSAVFNLNEPAIIKPIDGSTNKNYIDFLISDLGYYVNKNFQYYIEIDTSLAFSNPVKSDPLIPIEGLLKWRSPVLNNGTYFWRTRIADETGVLGKFSGARSFTLSDLISKGYTAQGKILETFNIYNMNYSDQNKSLSLNTQLLPPHPSNTSLIDSIFINSDVTDNVKLTSITTDGDYLYFGNIWYYALNHDTNGYSKIYKVGTGNNGTIKGNFYGEIPNSYGKIANQIFYHSDGFIYVATGESHRLMKINPKSGDTSSVFLIDGILRYDDSRPLDGSAYLASDGNYVYNLTIKDSLGKNKYILRIFDPSKNWTLVRPDIELSGTSYNPGFSSFFVSRGYLYPTESLINNYIRRIRISDGSFEEEWIAYRPIKSLYSWCYDWKNDNVYASVFSSDTTFKPKFEKFVGSYVDANGYFETPRIGPALTWNKITYNVENSSPKGTYISILKGFNKGTKNWDTLAVNMPNDYSLANINSNTYPYLTTFFSFTDSSFGIVNPMKFNNINISYETLPEINLAKNNFSFTPDTVIQGFNTSFNIKIDNLGDSDADSLTLKFYLDNQDTTYLLKKLNVPKDSSNSFSQSIPTSYLSPATFHKIKVIGSLPLPEYYTFNNLTENGFYVSRDSINPLFNITFDGKEIVNDDIISAKPEIIITMKDNSPLPMDTSIFSTLTFDDVPLNFTRPDLKFSYIPYPNSQATIKWNPTLTDGKHILEVYAKDPSGNFFDSISHKYEFLVYNQPDLLNVFNYPNPFKNDTYFTFEIHGQNAPEELKIKIFSVAGRLIRNISVPSSDLRVGFNKIYWNGRDQDGDEVANGVYFYKIIAINNGVVKTTTEKMARIR